MVQRRMFTPTVLSPTSRESTVGAAAFFAVAGAVIGGWALGQVRRSDGPYARLKGLKL
jgi:hypothetical protein